MYVCGIFLERSLRDIFMKLFLFQLQPSYDMKINVKSHRTFENFVKSHGNFENFFQDFLLFQFDIM